MEDSILDLVVDFMKKPALVDTFVDILLCAVPIWLAVMIGLVIGWSWRPRWTGILFLGLRSKVRFLWTAPPGFGARRLWLAVTAVSVCGRIWSNFRGKGKGSSAEVAEAEAAAATEGGDDARGSRVSDNEKTIVTEKDVEHLLHLLEGKGGEMMWQNFMERSTSNMAYKAWRYDPETGPTVYRSRTVFEDATPELVRDFFWDDEFRPKWDPMLTHVKVLEEWSHSGTTILHWIKKFPFFCSDREYIIGRRIWEAGNTYYCITKGVPYVGLEKREKPRRVELYFSSWTIKAVESRKRDGQLSACEVNLVHYEDMGIPNDVAKLAVRHGMWGTLKKLHSGMRAYQLARKSDASLSRCALMARITTKISLDGSMDTIDASEDEEERCGALEHQRHKDHAIDWKWVFIGGTVAIVCGIQTGVIGKVLLLGAGQRIARR